MRTPWSCGMYYSWFVCWWSHIEVENVKTWIVSDGLHYIDIQLALV